MLDVKGMSHEIRANYEQMDLLPQSLEDWVPRDHPARFIREVVDALDLRGLGFQPRESEEGRPPYANDLLLKVWLYGYLTRIRASRQLERACREHLSLVWLTGRHAPDHNTLWRFFRENRKALREVFRASVKVAAEQGLIGMVCQAVDGTKIRAVASSRTVEHRGNLEKALERVEASIEEMEAVIEQAEKEEGGRLSATGAIAESGTVAAGDWGIAGQDAGTATRSPAPSGARGAGDEVRRENRSGLQRAGGGRCSGWDHRSAGSGECGD